MVFISNGPMGLRASPAGRYRLTRVWVGSGSVGQVRSICRSGGLVWVGTSVEGLRNWSVGRQWVCVCASVRLRVRPCVTPARDTASPPPPHQTAVYKQTVADGGGGEGEGGVSVPPRPCRPADTTDRAAGCNRSRAVEWCGNRGTESPLPPPPQPPGRPNGRHSAPSPPADCG